MSEISDPDISNALRVAPRRRKTAYQPRQIVPISLTEKNGAFRAQAKINAARAQQAVIHADIFKSLKSGDARHVNASDMTIAGDIKGAKLQVLKACRALFQGGIIDVVIDRANLKGAIFAPGSQIQRVTAQAANLSSATLSDTIVSGSSFKDADLQGADLSGAFFDRVDFTGANFDVTLYSDAIFINCHGVDQLVDASLVEDLQLEILTEEFESVQKMLDNTEGLSVQKSLIKRIELKAKLADIQNKIKKFKLHDQRHMAQPNLERFKVRIETHINQLLARVKI